MANKRSAQFVGSRLNPNAGIIAAYQKPILTLVRRMCDETKKEMRKLLEDPRYSLDGASMDANPAARGSIIINRLLEKYNPLFAKWAKKTTDKMIGETLRYSASSLLKSLGDAKSESKKRMPGEERQLTLKDVGFKLEIDMAGEELQRVVKASTNEATMLIKTIAPEYLSDVQGELMRSISSGDGLKTLIPYLNDKYGKNIRKARNVAQDQTRKAYANINAARLKDAGVKKGVWIHSGGGKHPRKLHEDLDGKEFELENPPYIGDMYGKPVYGLPAQLPNCKCTWKPVLSFGD